MGGRGGFVNFPPLRRRGVHIRGRGLIWEGGLNRGFMVLWSAHFCTNKTNLKTYSVKLTHEMTPETIHCYCIRLALLLFFKGLKIILCVPHWCVSDLSKKCTCKFKFQHSECKHFSSTHHSSFLQTNTVNDQFNFCSPVGLHVLSFEPTALYYLFLSGFTWCFCFLLIRNLHLGPLLSSKFHTSTGCSATFSVTREIWGKTDAEIEEEKGIPEPPREVTLYNITRAIKFNGLSFSTGSAAEAKFSFRKDNNMIW